MVITIGKIALKCSEKILSSNECYRKYLSGIGVMA